MVLFEDGHVVPEEIAAFPEHTAAPGLAKRPTVVIHRTGIDLSFWAQRAAHAKRRSGLSSAWRLAA